MVEGGPIDVLCGDYLAELTMLIPAKAQAKDPSGGYARLSSPMEQVLGTCLDRGIKVVANAGGLNPAGLAAALRELSARLGLTARVAHVEGDDPRGLHAITPPVGDIKPVSANAYLGAWGITEALRSSADVVVTGRVTDASWWSVQPPGGTASARGLGSARGRGRRRARVIECGLRRQAATTRSSTRSPTAATWFPIAEVAEDGSR